VVRGVAESALPPSPRTSSLVDEKHSGGLVVVVFVGSHVVRLSLHDRYSCGVRQVNAGLNSSFFVEHRQGHGLSCDAHRLIAVNCSRALCIVVLTAHVHRRMALHG